MDVGINKYYLNSVNIRDVFTMWTHSNITAYTITKIISGT